ncbi:Bug family tripartite tricarboxylate transporter substrate binding protein [Vreelandella olivaria]|uniref:Bug family tripartite tricarboxylate transporter substrate binding protein n=1 Tax=Vreelandella olivaria TaxID=390919 RepID=UPI00201F8D65|nr:tripartite tricarboxylate transporter substrate binding protein [Halomonas olivaria]
MKTIFVLAAGLLISSTSALANDYPTRNIEIIVPFSAGGGNDVFVRALQPVLERELDTNLVVRNVPGGGGAVGLTQASRLPATGYNLVAVSDGTLTQVASGNVAFGVDDFTFIAKVLQEPYLLAVSQDSEYQTLEDMQAAIAEGTTVRVGVSGVGSSAHLTALAIADALETEFSTIPFDGGSETISAVMGGHIDAVVLGGAELRSSMSSGRVKALATSYPERSDALPDVPTFQEQGVDFTTSVFRGIAAPSGIPEEVNDRLVEAIEQAVQDEQFLRSAGNLGTDVETAYGEELEAFIQDLAERMQQQADRLN